MTIVGYLNVSSYHSLHDNIITFFDGHLSSFCNNIVLFLLSLGVIVFLNSKASLNTSDYYLKTVRRSKVFTDMPSTLPEYVTSMFYTVIIHSHKNSLPNL